MVLTRAAQQLPEKTWIGLQGQLWEGVSHSHMKCLLNEWMDEQMDMDR
jgi:hypothetical protein